VPPAAMDPERVVPELVKGVIAGPEREDGDRELLAGFARHAPTRERLALQTRAHEDRGEEGQHADCGASREPGIHRLRNNRGSSILPGRSGSTLADGVPMRHLLVAAAGGFVLAWAPAVFAQDVQPATAPVVETPSTTVVTTTPGPAVEAPVAQPGAAAPVRTVYVKEKDTDTEIQTGGLPLEWVYLNADMGFSTSDLVSIRSSNWQLQDSSQTGPAFGIGAGVRLVFLSLGARVRDIAYPNFNMWETDLEALFHFRVWRIDGYIGGRGGYAFLGQFSTDSIARSTSTDPSDVTVHGWNVGPAVGLDWYITKRLSVGVEGNAEFLFLERQAIPLKAGQMVPNGLEGLYAQSGSSVGAGFVGVAHLGVHF
jgi:hypothetical protein